MRKETDVNYVLNFADHYGIDRQDALDNPEIIERTLLFRLYVVRCEFKAMLRTFVAR